MVIPKEVGFTRQRRDHARSASSNTAIESFDRGTRGAIPPEPENGSKVAQTGLVEDMPMGLQDSRLAFPRFRGQVGAGADTQDLIKGLRISN